MSRTAEHARRDHLLLYECFHGDNGAGLGASHQTGWTGLVAMMIRRLGFLDAKTTLELGKLALFEPAAAVLRSEQSRPQTRRSKR